jgi:hypothetical protein
MRVENIEYILEKLFGPNGNFAKSNNTAFDDVKNYITQAVIYAKERGLNNVDSDLPSKQVRHFYKLFIHNIVHEIFCLFEL